MYTKFHVMLNGGLVFISEINLSSQLHVWMVDEVAMLPH